MTDKIALVMGGGAGTGRATVMAFAGGINTVGMQFYLKNMPEMRDKVMHAHAMGRLAEPEEIANAVVFLCSASASFITGHDLVVDGGALLRSNVLDL